MPSNYFLTRISILQKAVNGSSRGRHFGTKVLQSMGFQGASGNCWICLQHLADISLEPCHHCFCRGCVAKIRSINPEQVPVSLSAFTSSPSVSSSNSSGGGEESGSMLWMTGDEEYLGPILPDACPICNVRFTSMQENTAQRRTALTQKLLTMLDVDVDDINLRLKNIL